MPELVVGGVILKVEEFTRLPDEVGGNAAVRAVNGQLRGDPDWRKQAWAVTALALDDAEAVALRAAVAGGAVAASGDRLGGAFTVRVLVGDDEAVRTGPAIYRRLTLAIREI